MAEHELIFEMHCFAKKENYKRTHLLIFRTCQTRHVILFIEKS